MVPYDLKAMLEKWLPSTTASTPLQVAWAVAATEDANLALSMLAELVDEEPAIRAEFLRDFTTPAIAESPQPAPTRASERLHTVIAAVAKP